MQCATHHSVETELACGKCGKPICPRCLVYTPVGTRCRDCAQLRRLPQFVISPAFLLRGLAAGLGAGVVLGVLWGVLIPFTGLFFGLMVAVGLGYVVGEAVSVATNRKSGPQLQGLAALGVVVAFIVRGAIVASTSSRVDWQEVATQDFVGYAVAALAVFVAVGRVRR